MQIISMALAFKMKRRSSATQDVIDQFQPRHFAHSDKWHLLQFAKNFHSNVIKCKNKTSHLQIQSFIFKLGYSNMNIIKQAISLTFTQQ
jgi:hypothetical protein